MKRSKSYAHLTLYVPQQPAYPNAASKQYLIEKAVNILTGIASGLGLIFAMLFLVTLS